EEKKVDFSHNPFSMPQGGLEALEGQDPLTIRAYQYDIVCNGNEIGGGSIRIHRKDIQERVFKVMGISEEEAQEQFGFLLDAF
ncbi:aspartate--tRNA ligase, partial [Halomonas sp. ND22Bw]|uniref:amino acid--tRNA ligase-related protein n=1 Tax=Halomonas sp. ND22Bw TaxID=2054178 RepID=UPI000D2AE1AA